MMEHYWHRTPHWSWIKGVGTARLVSGKDWAAYPDPDGRQAGVFENRWQAEDWLIEQVGHAATTAKWVKVSEDVYRRLGGMVTREQSGYWRSETDDGVVWAFTDNAENGMAYIDSVLDDKSAADKINDDYETQQLGYVTYTPPHAATMAEGLNVAEEMESERTPAATLLHDAASVVDGHRSGGHGHPERTLAKIAEYWSLYLEADVFPADVARMMELLKIARGTDRDSCLDAAGYAALAWEVSRDDSEADDFEDIKIGGSG